LGAHANSPEFKAFQKALADEDLVGAPKQLKMVKPGMYLQDTSLPSLHVSQAMSHVYFIRGN
jgi:hypothetical protein